MPSERRSRPLADPGATMAQVEEAVRQGKAGRWIEAAALLETAALRAQSPAPIYHHLAKIYARRLDRALDAERCARVAVTMDPASTAYQATLLSLLAITSMLA